MASLPVFESISTKNNYFKVSRAHRNNLINEIDRFNRWYDQFSDKSKNELSPRYFFRGVGEAKHKLFNTAQRIWITTEIEKWKSGASYESFLTTLLNEAKKEPLFKRVFEFYKVGRFGKDFPILSILQHYGCPTPLMDWTYDIDVALFFATENIQNAGSSEEIDNYFSVYIINNDKTNIQSISDVESKQYPSLKKVFSRIDEKPAGTEHLLYLSDYESDSIAQPLTTIYNQNIIPQKGLFIFNPSPTMPLEDYFRKEQEYSSENTQFMVYNIRKDLAEYIRRKISNNQIVKALLFPDLKLNAMNIKEATLNSYFVEE